MRIKITRHDGQPFQIDTEDPRLAAKWLAEMLPNLLLTSQFGPAQLDIWPGSDEERMAIGQHSDLITSKSLMHLARSLIENAKLIDAELACVR